MDSFERSFIEELEKVAAEEAPAKSNNMANLLKVLAAGGLGYAGYKAYKGHQDSKAREAALLQQMAENSARNKRMLVGGALGAGALGAAHHFGLDESIFEKLKGLFGKAPMTPKEMAGTGLKVGKPVIDMFKDILSGKQVFEGPMLPANKLEYLKQHGKLPVEVPEQVKGIGKLLTEAGNHSEKVGPNAVKDTSVLDDIRLKLGPKY